MTKAKLTRRTFVGGSAVVAAAAAVGASPKLAKAQAKKTLRMRLQRDFQVLDPGYQVGGQEGVIDTATLGRLAQYKAGDQWGWEIASDFASKLQQTDDLNIAFTLKPGIRWSNNQGELTTEDVKYSYERMLVSDYKGKWAPLKEVKVVDKYNGVIVLKDPFSPLWLTTMCNAFGTIVNKAAWEKLEPDVKKNNVKYVTTQLPAQCGPLRMTEWVAKQRTTLIKNPDWKGKAPGYDEVVYIYIDDTKAAELALEAGEVDFTEVATDSLPRYTKTPPKDGKLLIRPGLTYTWMGMNTEHPKLKDIRVRKAIQRAVDRASILQAAYAGVAPPSFGIVPPGLIGKRNASKYSYNVNEAKELMKQAGVSDLTLELKTLNQPDRISAAQIIQANLAQIGVKVDILPVDSGVFWNLGIESKGEDWKNLQLWIMRFGGSPDPTDHFQWFVKSQVGIWNWERWSTQEFEDLYVAGQKERDTAKRNTMYLRMQEIMEDTGAYVWLTHEPTGMAHRNNVVPAVDPGGGRNLPAFRPA